MLLGTFQIIVGFIIDYEFHVLLIIYIVLQISVLGHRLELLLILITKTFNSRFQIFFYKMNQVYWGHLYSHYHIYLLHLMHF